MEVEKEFIESPIFSQLVISKDGKSSGIIITIKDNNEFINIVEKRSSLKKILNPTTSIKDELKIIEKKYNELKKNTDFEREKNIEEIRSIISKYRTDQVELHLGGVSMIANDTISYVKSDILIFGFGIILFIIFILYLIFKDIRWIILCLSNCIFALVIMTGIISFLNWKVTVISSNFISLMLI
jgi:predicted RND superfamily exporter protein